MNYDLTDIKLLMNIGDTGSVSRGAAACFLAPSSASLRIKRLEESLGVKLIQRQARGVALTPAGKVMVRHARTLFFGLEDMHAELAPYANGVRAHIRLLANSSAVASFLPDDLKSFLREQVEVRIVMNEIVSSKIIESLNEGKADIGVVTWSGDCPGLVFHPYHEDTLVVVVAADHPLAARAELGFAECLDYPFVLLQSGSAIYTFLTRQAAAAGRALDIRIQVSSFSSVMAMVAASAGISIMPLSAVKGGGSDDIRILSLSEPWAQRELRICVRDEDLPAGGYVWKLVEHLRMRQAPLRG